MQTMTWQTVELPLMLSRWGFQMIWNQNLFSNLFWSKLQPVMTKFQAPKINRRTCEAYFSPASCSLWKVHCLLIADKVNEFQTVIKRTIWERSTLLCQQHNNNILAVFPITVSGGPKTLPNIPKTDVCLSNTLNPGSSRGAWFMRWTPCVSHQ